MSQSVQPAIARWYNAARCSTVSHTSALADISSTPSTSRACTLPSDSEHRRASRRWLRSGASARSSGKICRRAICGLCGRRRMRRSRDRRACIVQAYVRDNFGGRRRLRSCSRMRQRPGSPRKHSIQAVMRHWPGTGWQEGVVRGQLGGDGRRWEGCDLLPRVWPSCAQRVGDAYPRTFMSTHPTLALGTWHTHLALIWLLAVIPPHLLPPSSHHQVVSKRVVACAVVDSSTKRHH